MSAGVGVSGLWELNQEFDDFNEAITNEIITALQRGGMIIENEAKLRCPWDTGKLRSSITTDVERLEMNTFKLTVGTNVEYARYVEFGTYKMAARPYLRPAVDATAEEVVDEIRGSIRSQITGRMIRR